MTSFYLTGSINVPSTDAAFRLVGQRLQPGVTRVPDGEPGDRANWVLVHSAHFLDNPTLDVVDGRARVRSGTPVSFGDVDYHSSAIASYEDFRRARDEGALAPESRFLVSIATGVDQVSLASCALGRFEAETTTA